MKDGVCAPSFLLSMARSSFIPRGQQYHFYGILGEKGESKDVVIAK